jgi:DNA-binding winged helix-turn-helix (wHTH) protein/Tfp pilus assembly protein PilF
MSIYKIGPFELNTNRLTLRTSGKDVAAGPRVVETLLALAESSGQVLSKKALLERIWPDGFVEEANLTQNIYVLRKMFRAFGSADAIETVPGVGYRLTADVRQIESQKQKSLRAGFAAAAFVAASIVLTASGSGVHAGRPGTLSDDGARMYQIGRYYWNLRTADGVQKSMVYFQRVVDADPSSAQGYAALADANLTMGDYCYGTHRPATYFKRAGAYARQALALDPNSADANAALGFLALRMGRIADALAELRRAVALNASYGPAHEWYGIVLLKRGDRAGALAQFKIAADLDPLSVAAAAWVGSASYLNRRFDDAIAYSRQALELTPQRSDALITLGRALQASGNRTGALAAFRSYGESEYARLHQRKHGSGIENAARWE